MHYHMEKEKPHDINRSSMGFPPWHQGWELCQGEVGDQAESVHAEAQRRTPLPPSHHLRGCPSRLSIPVDVYQSAGGCPNNRTVNATPQLYNRSTDPDLQGTPPVESRSL